MKQLVFDKNFPKEEPSKQKNRDFPFYQGLKFLSTRQLLRHLLVQAPPHYFEDIFHRPALLYCPLFACHLLSEFHQSRFPLAVMSLEPLPPLATLPGVHYFEDIFHRPALLYCPLFACHLLSEFHQSRFPLAVMSLEPLPPLATLPGVHYFEDIFHR